MLEAEARSGDEAGAAPFSGTGDRRVLVVDDSRAQRMLLSVRLRRWGYEVIEAGTGAEALGIAAGANIPLILSDWVMPELSGPEFCRALRAIETDLRSHFILLTSRHEKADVARGLDAGADDFLSKPVDEGELVARLKAGERVIALQRRLVAQRAEIAAALERSTAMHDRLEQDLRAASELQKAFLPPPFAVVNGFPVGAVCIPAGHVGGDLVGCLPIGPHGLGVYSIDVAGHGVASSLIAIQLAQHFGAANAKENIAFALDAAGRTCLRAPHEVVADLNARFLGDGGHDLYFTMSYALIDARSGALRICQAGHPEAMVLRAGGGIEALGNGGPPVGLLPDVEFGDETATLGPGDRLLLHSDGITEAELADGTLLETEGLRALLANHPACPTRRLLPDLVGRLTRRTGRQDFEDDLSALVVEFAGAAGLSVAADG